MPGHVKAPSGGETTATRASLNLDTDDSPQFAGINLGHASDTTLTRVSSGVAAIEGNTIYTMGTTTGNNNIDLTDNLADAFSIKQSSNKYITITTTNSEEKLILDSPSGIDIGIQNNVASIVIGKNHTENFTKIDSQNFNLDNLPVINYNSEGEDSLPSGNRRVYIDYQGGSSFGWLAITNAS